jgi:Cu(I)-responsive transcriptional regulator
MKIGAAADAAGLSVKTVRYYADIGLIAPDRSASGYRDYDAATVEKLRFVGRARTFGFGLSECRELLSLYEDRSRASADVKRMAEDKIAALDRKLAELHELRNELARVADACAGDARPDCPILDRFAAS